MKRLILYLLLIFCFHSTVFSQSTAGNAELLLRREMQERHIPGLQVAVVQSGKIIFLKSYGIANLQDSVATTDKSIFAINSCTKAFTGVAIMQLVEEGKVDLSAPVSQYLDDLPAAWRPITVRQLLIHVSGLPDVLRILNASPGTGLSEDAVWQKVKTMPLEFPIGERFSYNQTNYALLGKIIDRLSAKPFVKVFSEKQFEIAGMSNTGFGDSRDVIPGMAPTYRYISNPDGQQIDGRFINNYAEFPPFRRTASGMNSTAEDLAKWLIALQAGKLLKNRKAIETLWKAGTYNSGQPTQWALGWVTKPRDRHQAVIATGGGRSAFFVYPEDDLAVVVLTNLNGAYPEEFIDELAGVFKPEIATSDPVTVLRVGLRKRGFENTEEVFDELSKNNERFLPLETDLNDWAYRMLSRGQKKQALEILKLNVRLYPESPNVYDSVAEAYESLGEKELAIKNYKRSLELDSQNTNAIQHLKKLDPKYK